MSNNTEEELESLDNSIKQLQQNIQKNWNDLNNPLIVAREISTALSSFIDASFEQITDNEDMVQVNSVLVTALAQIKNYLIDKPSSLKIQLEKLSSAYQAYGSCLELIDKCKENIEEEQKKDTEEEILIGKDNEELVEAFVDKNNSQIRKVGQRPESLRKIRQEMTKNLEDDS